MAGDWIPMRLNLADDPAVIAVSDATGLDEFAVVGRLHRLWAWANQHTRDGHASVTLARIDRQLCHTGFAEALVSAGWLTVSDNGRVTFPKYDVWNSNAAKKRLSATRRKHLQRERDAAPVSRKRHARVTKASRENVTREEKRRVENKEKTNTLPASAGGVVEPVVVGTSSAAKPARPRDELFDALVAVTGADPRVNGGHVGKVRKLLLDAEPPYTPAEVMRFADPAFLARELTWLDGRKPTLGEIEKHIGRVRNPSAGPPRPPPGRGGFKSPGEASLDFFTRTTLDAQED